MPRWTAVLLVVVAAVLGGAASASAQTAASGICAPLNDANAAPFTTNTNHVGLVDLHFFDAQGVPVTYYECISGRAHELGVVATPNAAITSLPGATPWLCGRLDRHFAATATLPGGQFVRGLASVRTMSCAHRFGIEAPRQVAARQLARVRIVDRWGIGGLRTRLCFVSPTRERDCHSVAFPAASGVQTRRFRPAARGDWTVDLQVRSFHVTSAVAVGVKAAKVAALPGLLATGDSTMQGVESSLADDVGDEFAVASDVHPGFSISSADGWAAIAQDQVKRLKPQTVVMSLGAAEGFDMQGADGRRHSCCDAQWVGEYVRRVRRVMNIYRRGGTAQVYYLTIVAPREPARQTVVNAVNAAIIRAAKGLPGVHVLRMDLLFSPKGYVDTIRDGGRDVNIREPDGVHLNASGTAIEARETAKAIRGEANEVPVG